MFRGAPLPCARAIASGSQARTSALHAASQSADAVPVQTGFARGGVGTTEGAASADAEGGEEGTGGAAAATTALALDEAEAELVGAVTSGAAVCRERNTHAAPGTPTLTTSVVATIHRSLEDAAAAGFFKAGGSKGARLSTSVASPKAVRAALAN